jgi:hypothetical protein
VRAISSCARPTSRWRAISASREKLARQVAAARASGADLIACDCIEFHPDGREILRRKRPPAGWSHLKAICHEKWIALPSTVLVRKPAIAAAGGFDPDLRACEDGDMWRRIAWRHAIHEVDAPLVRYRRHAGAVSEDRRKMRRSDLHHAVKMLRDTPRELRGAVPSPLSVLRKVALRSLMPGFLRQPRKALAARLMLRRP